jgi:hypothetical protein
MPTYLPIGLGAGLAAAVLFASASTGSLLTRFLLFFLAPLPAFLAGLGWGWLAALTASIAGTLVIGLVTSPGIALVYGLSQGAPVVLLCYLAYLNRVAGQLPDGSPDVEWYPVGRLVLWAAVVAGALAGLSLLMLGGDLAALRSGLKVFLEKTVLQELSPLGGKTLSPQQVDALTDVALYMLPAVSAISWLMGFLFNLWLAGRITLASGRLLRPWPDLAGIHFPPGSALGLAAATGASFMTGIVGLMAAGVAGALLMAYVLLGLAIAHYATRGKAWRPFLLSAIYAALLMLVPWSALGIALIGLAEPFAPWRRRYPAPPAPPPPPGPSGPAS